LCGIGDGRAVIAARGGDHACARHVAQQQVGEGPARLERAGMLQLLQLEQQPTRREAELACIHRDHRRATHMGADQALGRGYVVAGDRDGLMRHDIRHGVLLLIR